MESNINKKFPKITPFILALGIITIAAIILSFFFEKGKDRNNILGTYEEYYYGQHNQNPDEDGYIQNLDGSCTVFLKPLHDGYVREEKSFSGHTFITFYNETILANYQYAAYGMYTQNIGFIEWDLSSIPNSAIILDSQLRYTGLNNTQTYNYSISSILNQSTLNLTSQEIAQYPSENIYASSLSLNGTNITDLLNETSSDIQTQLVDNWFAIKVTYGYSNHNLYSSMSNYPPILIVNYLPNPVSYSENYYYSCAGEKITPGIAIIRPYPTSSNIKLSMGSTYSYQIVLLSKPQDDVVVKIELKDPSSQSFIDSIMQIISVQASSLMGFSLDPNTLTFTPDNWNIPQTVSVIADSITSNSRIMLTHQVQSDDRWYHEYELDALNFSTIQNSSGETVIFEELTQPTPTPSSENTTENELKTLQTNEQTTQKSSDTIANLTPETIQTQEQEIAFTQLEEQFKENDTVDTFTTPIKSQTSYIFHLLWFFYFLVPTILFVLLANKVYKYLKKRETKNQ